MAELNFPNSPSIGDTFSSSEKTWEWDGSAWQAVVLPALPDQTSQSGKYLTTDGTDTSWEAVSYSELTDLPTSFTPSAHASSHESGGTDEIEIAQSQVTDLTTDLDGKFDKTGGTVTGYTEINHSPASGELLAVEGAAGDTNHADLRLETTSAGNARFFLKTPNASYEFFAESSGQSFGVYDNIAAAARMRIQPDGEVQLPGKVNSSLPKDNTAQFRNITLSTSQPTGGEDGDMWFVYTP